MSDESGWFSIDDPDNPAPRDGSIVLLADHRLVVAGFWIGPERDERFPWRFLDDTYAASGLNGWMHDMHGHGPTHWMPLPAPPEPSS